MNDRKTPWVFLLHQLTHTVLGHNPHLLTVRPIGGNNGEDHPDPVITRCVYRNILGGRKETMMDKKD